MDSNDIKEPDTKPISTSTEALVEVEEVDAESDNTLLTMAAVENLIKRKILQIEELKDTGRTYKEMIDSYLENDEEYSRLDLQAKEAAKAKNAKKKNLLELNEIKSTADKYKENQLELKEIRQSLSNDLNQFQKLSGASEIELEAGDLRQIVYVAKLVKRAQQG